MENLPRLITMILSAAILYSVSRYSRRLRANPHRSPQNSARIRLPKFIVVLAIFFLGMGLLMLVSLVGIPGRSPGSMITSVLFILAGFFFLSLYRNWFIEIHQDHVLFRGIGSKEKIIWYTQIVSYRLWTQNNKPMLRVKSADGTSLTMDLSVYDGGALLQYVYWLEDSARQQNGYPPLYGTPTPPPAATPFPPQGAPAQPAAYPQQPNGDPRLPDPWEKPVQWSAADERLDEIFPASAQNPQKSTNTPVTPPPAVSQQGTSAWSDDKTRGKHRGPFFDR